MYKMLNKTNVTFVCLSAFDIIKLLYKKEIKIMRTYLKVLSVHLSSEKSAGQ